MSRRIFVLLASYSNNWLIRGYSTYKQSKNIISNNNIPSMSANCADYSNRNHNNNIIHNDNRNVHSIQIPIDKKRHEMLDTVAGIDFSSSFSDDTSMKELEDEYLEDDDMELSVAFSDDEALLQMLGSRTFHAPPLKKDDNIDLVCNNYNAERTVLSPENSRINIMDCSSPKHKRVKPEPVVTNPVEYPIKHSIPETIVTIPAEHPVKHSILPKRLTTEVTEPFSNTTNQLRSFSTSSVRSKKLENIYPTIQLATQKAFNIEDDSEIKKSNAIKSTDTVKSVKPIVLSGEQEYVLQLATGGQSLFYTGSAGTGKSVLLRSIIKSLKQKHEKGHVAVTASTGLAACNIGGITLHSFAGVGLGDGTVSALMKKIRRNKKAYFRWCLVKVLIIDEISMIDGIFLNKLDSISKTLRKNNKPFGGIQLIVCGDFYQLPPVNKIKPTNQMSLNGQNIVEESIFAFESQAWKDTIKCTIILKEVFRQKGDQRFIDMLNDMRNGKVNNETIAEFKRLSRRLDNPDGIEPAELFSTRYEVENANNTRLNLLKGESQIFKAIDSGSLPTEQRQTVLNNFLAPQKLFLKKNAQVMCIKNFDETLVNGSLGQVVNFMDRDTYMHYNLMKENPEATISEIEREFKKNKEKKKIVDELEAEHKPLSLNDSIFDFLEDIEIMEGLHDVELDVHELAFRTNKERKVDFIKALHQNSSKLKYPLVRFLLPDGYNTREVLVEPEQWTIEDENENVLARRIQLPLILAWSLSIHKSQGQTLPKVKVDLKRVFEKGQAYVALSRAVSRNGLQVLNFNKDKIMAHPKVNKFYESLSSTEELAVTTNDFARPHLLEPKEKRHKERIMIS
ncbi:unnamed protein product [Debaryomyces tyrocola]|nr:unnamed protein product [Debaryomyces tyrocola]